MRVNVRRKFTCRLQTRNCQCNDPYIIDLTKSLRSVIMMSELRNKQEIEFNTFYIVT